MKKLLLTLICALTCVSLLTGCSNKKDPFYEDYEDATNKTLFKTINDKELVEFLENGTGVLFLSFPQCPWCHAFLPVIEQSTKNANINQVYYYDIYEDRKNETDLYHKVCELLDGELDFDNDGNPRIFVPDVTVIDHGSIIYHTNETSMTSSDEITPDAYWTDEQRQQSIDALTSALKKLNS